MELILQKTIGEPPQFVFRRNLPIFQYSPFTGNPLDTFLYQDFFSSLTRTPSHLL
jgi:hypothetical protein